jgi:hypothetical protein
MRAESLGIPQFAYQCAEAKGQLRRAWYRKLMQQEIVTNREDVSQDLDDDVKIIVGFDVVHSHEAYKGNKMR